MGRRTRRVCNCGQPAVARALVRVGLDGQYLVRLYLCAACLEDELASADVPPPLKITRFRP